MPVPIRLAAVEIHLSMPPFTHQVRESRFLRQLVFRLAQGHVALYVIKAGSVVNILAIGHQFEDAYH